MGTPPFEPILGGSPASCVVVSGPGESATSIDGSWEEPRPAVPEIPMVDDGCLAKEAGMEALRATTLLDGLNFF